MAPHRSPSSLEFRGSRAVRLRALLLRQLPIRCPLCGFTFTEPGDVQVDHIVPIAMGGAVWDMSNVRLLCAPCNQGRGAALANGVPFTPPGQRRGPPVVIRSSRMW